MGKPAAKQGDRIVAVDTHILMVPSPGGPVPTPTSMPLSGVLDGALSGDVVVEDQAAAVKGSTADNSPAHLPTAGPFQRQPSNRGTVDTGSPTVLVNGQPIARSGDTVITCNDPGDAPNGTVTLTVASAAPGSRIKFLVSRLDPTLDKDPLNTAPVSFLPNAQVTSSSLSLPVAVSTACSKSSVPRVP